MVLIIDKKRENVPNSIADFYNDFPIYRESASKFLSIGIREIEPKGVLYVGQREFAAISSQDYNVEIVGSDDATTCIIAIIRHSESGAAALAHFDGTDMKQVVTKMIELVQDLSTSCAEGKLLLHLIGGYSDEQGYSEEIFYNCLNLFQCYPLEIHVTLVCVGELNTIVRNEIPWPIVYGAGLHLKTGEIFPASFCNKGPVEDLRHARLYSPSEFIEIYNSKLGLLKIDPFNYKCRFDIECLLKQSDRFILENFSTSPLVEPPNYAEQTRSTWKFIKENPDPSQTVFANGKSHFFKRNVDCSAWEPAVV